MNANETKIKVAAVYARRSVDSPNSVSVAAQIDAARKLIAARGWLEGPIYRDDGVSAIKEVAPERPGFGQALAEAADYDALVVYRLDRLARSVSDFIQTSQLLAQSEVELVSINDGFDLTKPEGRMLSIVLAAIAELEAEYIKERYTAARNFALNQGRLVGGTVPFGWRKAPNPDGHGYVLERDEEQARVLAEMVDRTLRGDSIYSLKRWLEASQIPSPNRAQPNQWSYSTIERLLRNPRIAGMTPYSPGRGRHDPPAPWAVLRESDGKPVVDQRTAVISLEKRQLLLQKLDGRQSPQARPRTSKRATSPLLAGAVMCGHCERTMTRKTLDKRPALHCPSCKQSISRNQLDPYLSDALLRVRGDEKNFRVVEVYLSANSEIARLDQAIDHTGEQLKKSTEDLDALFASLRSLRAERDRLSKNDGRKTLQWLADSRTVREAWHEAESDEERREILLTHMPTISIVRGKVGRYLDTNRVKITWSEPGALQRPTTGSEVPYRRVSLSDLEPDHEARIGPITLGLPAGPRRVKFEQSSNPPHRRS